ncbi:MAG TPA: DinB family protein [Ktedonobacteraceae bacterium]|jgi:hypothetical protein|nr:DinB family protein [Ktedonobacteraceae bacterium]
MSTNPSQEAALFCYYILSSMDRLLQTIDGLSAEQLNWHPSAPNTNSLYVLVVHSMSNAEENICHTLIGEPSTRDREQEFRAKGSSADELLAHWQTLRPRLEATISSLSTEDLHRQIVHPRRGTITGLDILIVVARHMAEHFGHAELTRDLLLAANVQ